MGRLDERADGIPGAEHDFSTLHASDNRTGDPEDATPLGLPNEDGAATYLPHETDRRPVEVPDPHPLPEDRQSFIQFHRPYSRAETPRRTAVRDLPAAAWQSGAGGGSQRIYETQG